MYGMTWNEWGVCATDKITNSLVLGSIRLSHPGTTAIPWSGQAWVSSHYDDLWDQSTNWPTDWPTGQQTDWLCPARVPTNQLIDQLDDRPTNCAWPRHVCQDICKNKGNVYTCNVHGWLCIRVYMYTPLVWWTATPLCGHILLVSCYTSCGMSTALH